MEVTRQTVSKWERGVIAPTAEKLIALSRLYGVSLDELVNGEPQCGEPPATAAAVEENPDAAQRSRRTDTWKMARAVALVVCVLLTVVVITVTICSAIFKEPEDGPIRIDDLIGEDIDPSEITNIPAGPGGIVIMKDEAE